MGALYLLNNYINPVEYSLSDSSVYSVHSMVGKCSEVLVRLAVAAVALWVLDPSK